MKHLLWMVLPIFILPASVPVKGYWATRALTHAVEWDDFEAARQALSNGADANRKDSEGTSLIMQAIDYGHWDTVAVLSQAGARINPDEKLLLACAQGRVNDVKALLGQGANANATDAQGDPALSYAAAWNRGDVMRVLIRQGAHIHARSEEGRTALDWATESDCAYAVALLKKHSKTRPSRRD